MSEDDDYRVEARLAGASRGVSPTTEQIQTLLERQRAHEKLTRAPPQKAFARVMRDQGQGEPNQSEDQAPDETESAENPPQTAAAPLAATRDTFVRRGGVPPGFQRSGRREARAATPTADTFVQTPLPTGPPIRPTRAAQPAQVTQGATGKKVIIRG